MYGIQLCVKTQTLVNEQFNEIVGRLVAEGQGELVENRDSRRLSWVWVVLIGVFVIAGAYAWSVCLARGYRGFEGSIQLHTKWRIPIGIKIACF